MNQYSGVSPNITLDFYDFQQVHDMMKRKAIFPGTFDPITNGHLDLIDRARTLFDEVIVGVAGDTTGKQTHFSLEKRRALVEAALFSRQGVVVKAFTGLLVDFYENEKATALIRGVRSSKDFDYEFEMAQVNQSLSKQVETVFMVPSPAHLFISASLVREIARLGGDIRPFVPVGVVEAFS